MTRQSGTVSLENISGSLRATTEREMKEDRRLEVVRDRTISIEGNAEGMENESCPVFCVWSAGCCLGT